MSYFHRQLSPIAAILAGMLLLGALQRLLHDSPGPSFGFAGVAFALLAASFGWLETRVDAEGLSYAFWPLGILRGHIALRDIADVQRVQTNIFSGTGLHLSMKTRNAWIWSAMPGPAVQITTAASKAVIIGSDDADGLIAALRAQLA